MYKLVAVSSALVGIASALTVNTPASLVQCQPALLSWADGTGPYYLAIIPGGQPSAAALENLPTQQGNTYTWTVDLAAGQSVTVKITDSTGAVNYSDQVPVQAGTSNTCAAGGSGSSPAAGAGSSSSAARAPLSTSTAAAVAGTTSGMATKISTPSSTTSVTSGLGAAAAATTSPASTPAATATTKSNSAAGSAKIATGLLLCAAAAVFALAA